MSSRSKETRAVSTEYGTALSCELDRASSQQLMTPQGPLGALPAVPGVADQAQANLWNTRFHSGQAGARPSQLCALPGSSIGSTPQSAAVAAADDPEPQPKKARAKQQARAKAKSKPTLEQLQPLSEEMVLAEALKYCQMLAAFVTKHRSDVEKAKELGLATTSVHRLEELVGELSVTFEKIQGLLVSQTRDVGAYRPMMEAACSAPALVHTCLFKNLVHHTCYGVHPCHGQRTHVCS